MVSKIAHIASVDIVVVGSSTSAAAAGVAAKAQGASVFLLSDRPYFGVETAGALQLNIAPDAVLRSAFPALEDLDGPLLPGAFKHAIEQRLLKEEIPFLYSTRPVAVLKGERGRLKGIVFAYYTRLYVIESSHFIDLSVHGHLSHLVRNKAPLLERGSIDGALNGIALTDAPPIGSPPLGKPFEAKYGGEMRSMQLHQWQASVSIPSGGIAAYASFEHRFRSQIVAPSVLLADAFIPKNVRPSSGVDDPTSLRETDFSICRGLWSGYAGLPLSRLGYDVLHEASTQIVLGHRLGRLVARQAIEGKSPTSSREAEISPQGPRIAKFTRSEPVSETEFDFSRFPVIAQCDVLVVGGGRVGAPCGITAAQKGAHTIILEMRRGLGGSGVSKTTGFCEKATDFAADSNQAISANVAPVRGSKEEGYNQQLLNAGGEAWLGSFAFGVQMEGEHLKGVFVSTPFGPGLIEAKCVIDATGRGDIAEAAGVFDRIIGDAAFLQGCELLLQFARSSSTQSDLDAFNDTDPFGATHAIVTSRAQSREEFDTIPDFAPPERRPVFWKIFPFDTPHGERSSLPRRFAVR